jgi:archaellum component FlaF (FlaF/FlaG flagellin family)
MLKIPYQNRRVDWISFCFWMAVIGLVLVGGCGGGSGPSAVSGGGGGSGGGSGPGGGGFQARPFPGDYFMRLPNQDGGALVPSEAYDPALKELFVSNPDINAVEVYSTVDGQRVGEIAVPGPAGLSFSPGDTELVVGTITPYVYILNPSTLHVISQIQIPESLLTTDAQGTINMPVMPYAMADGSIFLGMGVNTESGSYSYTLVGHPLRYQPASGTFTAEDPGTGGVNGNPVLSLDGTSLLVPGLSANGLALFLYTTGAQGYVASSSGLQNIGYLLAANENGSQFATVQQDPEPGIVTFLNSNLQAGSQYTTSLPVAASPIFSRDGKYLYVMPQNAILVALNTQTATPAGYIGVTIGLIDPIPQFFDVDEGYHLFGAGQPGGALVLDASQLQASLPTALAEFTLPSTDANPNVGRVAGGTQVQFIPAPAASGGSADGINSTTEAYFGATPATQDVVTQYPPSSSGQNFLTATAPPAGAPGPTSVVLTDANNNTVFLADAYTHGPHLLRVEPNVASAAGGDRITIFAYGLGSFNVADIHVTIGGTALNMLDAILNSYASFEYPEQSVTVTVPSGTPGWADIALSTSNGSDTLKHGLQYLNQEVNVQSGQFGFAVYDSVRNLFYLTGNGNSVAVFDPGTQTFAQPLQSAAISTGAVLAGESLTPDNSELLVADPSDQLVIVFNLAANSSSSVSVILPSDPATTLAAPMSIVTAADSRAFVSLTPCITNPVREIILTNLSVQARPDATSTCGTYIPYPSLGASSADGSTIIFAGNSGEQPPGPEYVWSYNAGSDSFTGPVLIADTPWVGGTAAVNEDGSVLSVSQRTVDQRLLPLVPTVSTQLDSRLNESGSLLYGAESGSLLYSVSNAVSVSDTRNGRQLLLIGLPSSMGSYRPLAIDPTGEKILVATQTGISYFELGVIPLAVGTVTPAQGSAGASIQVRGSGFVASTAVQIGGSSAACTEVDSETMSCTVPGLPQGAAAMTLTNSDGQTYTFENAFVVL